MTDKFYKSTCPKNILFTGPPGDTKWDGSGRMYRLVTRKFNSTTHEYEVSTPAEWYAKKLLL